MTAIDLVVCPFCGYRIAGMLATHTPNRHCPNCQKGKIADFERMSNIVKRAKDTRLFDSNSEEMRSIHLDEMDAKWITHLN